MRRTKEDSEKTRTAILLAAEELFLEKGVSHTSLEQIARAAGVTRGAVYWHFQNKAHLFNEMLNQVRLPPEQLTERLSGCDGSDPLRSLYDLCLEAVQSLLTQEKKRRILTILMQRCEFTEELREAQERNNDVHRTLRAVVRPRRMPCAAASGHDPEDRLARLARADPGPVQRLVARSAPVRSGYGRGTPAGADVPWPGARLGSGQLGAVALLANRLEYLGAVEPAGDPDFAGAKIHLDVRRRILRLHRMGDRPYAVAAGHALNLEDLHGIASCWSSMGRFSTLTWCQGQSSKYPVTDKASRTGKGGVKRLKPYKAHG
ncbi:bacterial regulatory, tetR family protein [Pseudomonas aeruginosa]|nr:bacterial regulatory, tetR family protein [Pseudomonas aeruginosa]